MADKTDIEIAADLVQVKADKERIERRLEAVEKDLRDVRDIARDTLHTVVGINGNNGLKSVISELSATVTQMKDDFAVFGETVKNYKELKSILLKVLLSGLGVFVIQVGSWIWFLSADHVNQVHLSQELEKLSKQQEIIKRNVIPEGSAP